MQMTRIVLPGMKERRKGAIVNIGSAAATVAPSGPLYCVYAGTKVSHGDPSHAHKDASCCHQSYPDLRDAIIAPYIVRTTCLLSAGGCLADETLESVLLRIAAMTCTLTVCVSQAYVDMFSKSLDLEYKQYGISVHNQAPAYVATKMSKIRKPTMDAPSPANWVAAAVKHIGYEPTQCPFP